MSDRDAELQKHMAEIEADEGLRETLEIFNDEEALAQLRQGLREMEEGKAIPWEEVKASLRAEDHLPRNR